MHAAEPAEGRACAAAAPGVGRGRGTSSPPAGVRVVMGRRRSGRGLDSESRSRPMAGPQKPAGPGRVWRGASDRHRDGPGGPLTTPRCAAQAAGARANAPSERSRHGESGGGGGVGLRRDCGRASPAPPRHQRGVPLALRGVHSSDPRFPPFHCAASMSTRRVRRRRAAACARRRRRRRKRPAPRLLESRRAGGGPSQDSRAADATLNTCISPRTEPVPPAAPSSVTPPPSPPTPPVQSSARSPPGYKRRAHARFAGCTRRRVKI